MFTFAERRRKQKVEDGGKRRWVRTFYVKSLMGLLQNLEKHPRLLLCIKCDRLFFVPGLEGAVRTTGCYWSDQIWLC